MKLKHITFTGIDEKTDIAKLVEIQQQYPLAEFGMLVSYNWKDKGQRYPAPQLVHTLSKTGLNLSLHLCGKAAHNAAFGGWAFVDSLLLDHINTFKRIQLNVSTHKLNPLFCRIPPYDNQEVIIQQKDVNNIRLFRETREQWGSVADYFSVLLDASGGRGVDTPIEVLEGDFKVGYAGGIGPDNVEDKLSYLLHNERVGDFWIDMESGVRTNDWLDLDKVRQVLEICDKVLKGDKQ